MGQVHPIWALATGAAFGSLRLGLRLIDVLDPTARQFQGPIGEHGGWHVLVLVDMVALTPDSSNGSHMPTSAYL